MTKHHDDEKALAKAQADKLAQDEAEADAYGQKMVGEPEAKVAEAEEEPARFTTGGATYDEIAAWREAHGTPPELGVYAPGEATVTVEGSTCD